MTDTRFQDIEIQGNDLVVDNNSLAKVSAGSISSDYYILAYDPTSHSGVYEHATSFISRVAGSALATHPTYNPITGELRFAFKDGTSESITLNTGNGDVNVVLATAAPPAVANQSRVGGSNKAAREDHTHESNFTLDAIYNFNKSIITGSTVAYDDTHRTITLEVAANPTDDATRNLSKLQIGDIIYSVVSDWDSITNKPARLGAFTQADETKLDGIETNAQVNPDNVISFRTEDGNSVIDGVIHFYTSDNDQWQNGPASTNLAAVEIDPNQFSLSQDPTNPASIPEYTGWHSLPDNLATRGGSSIWNFHYGGSGINFPNDPTLIVQAETIIKNDDGNYVLQNLTILKDFTITGSGYNWQIAGVFAPPTGADAVIGQIPYSQIKNVPARVGKFTAQDETNLDNLVAEDDTSLGYYTRVASASSLAAGQFHYASGTLQLVSASGQDVHPFWHSGDIFTLGNARFMLTSGSTIGVNRVTGGVAISEGELPNVNQGGNLVHKGVLARTGDLARVARTGEYNDLKDRPDVVTKQEIEGKETDRYSSYNNAFVANSYKSGDWVLTTDTSGPPTSDNQIRQPDIVTGSGLIAFGRLRTDQDPNNLQWASVLTGNEYSNGDVIHVTIYDNPDHGHLRITLTSDLTLVGTGDSAYVWATASWVEVGNVADVQDVGDYFKFAEYAPSDLDLRIPAGDIIDPPWLKPDASNVTDAQKDAIQGDNEEVDLVNTFRIDATNVDYYVSFNEAGVLNICTIRLPSSAANSKDDADLTRLVKDRNWADIGGYVIDVTTNATRSIIGTSLTFVFNYDVVFGTKPTGSTPVNISVYGEDVHRGEIARAAFRNETPSIAGKGGTDDQVWTRKSGKGQWADADVKDNYMFFADDAAVGGSGNAITVTCSPTADAYRDGMQVIFEPTANNSASATINVDGLGAKTIVREDGTTLESGDIINDRFAHVVYDGVFFVLLNRHIPAPDRPTSQRFVSLGSEGAGTWTDVLTGKSLDAVFSATGFDGTDNKPVASIVGYRLGDIPTNANTWGVATPASGRRVQFRRQADGSNWKLQAQTAATGWTLQSLIVTDEVREVSA